MRLFRRVASEKQRQWAREDAAFMRLVGDIAAAWREGHILGEQLRSCSDFTSLAMERERGRGL